MKALLKLFDDELDRYLDVDNPLVIVIPSYYEKLIRELKATNGKKLIKAMQTCTVNPIKLIRLFSIINLILLHSKDWF